MFFIHNILPLTVNHYNFPGFCERFRNYPPLISLVVSFYVTLFLCFQVLDNWHTNHIDSHFTGYLPAAHCDESIKDLMANMVGARPNEVAIMNGLTVNLHLMMVSFYKPTPSRHKILLEAKAFPSDHYVVESHIKMRGYNPEESMLEVAFNKDSLWDMDEIIKIIEDQGDSIAVILLPGVQYLTGQVFDMERITKAAHRKGCMVGFDLAHAVGNIQLSLHDWDVDFACWCTYKYVNAGAGGIAGVFLNERIDTSNMDKLSGWWGHKMETRFHMSNKMDLSPGIDGYRLSNPPPLLCAPLHASLEIFNGASMKKLSAKQFKLTGYLELLLKHYFTTDDNTRIGIVTPTSTKERGSMLCLRFARPVDQIFDEVQKYGCIVDKRKPDIMRVTPAPLYCSFEDVYRFVNVLRIVLRDM